MPSPAALSCQNTSGGLPVVALLDLGECMLSMAPCYLKQFLAQLRSSRYRSPIDWETESQLMLQETMVDLVSCYPTSTLHVLFL